jgi:hypothetical protein
MASQARSRGSQAESRQVQASPALFQEIKDCLFLAAAKAGWAGRDGKLIPNQPNLIKMQTKNRPKQTKKSFLYPSKKAHDEIAILCYLTSND